MASKNPLKNPDGLQHQFGDAWFKVAFACTGSRASCNYCHTRFVKTLQALRIVVGDVLEQCSRGARIVSHNLPFDAGLIYEELGRAGLDHLKADWAQAVRNGIDTMDPDVAGWARKKIGYEQHSWRAPTKLRDLVSGFVPGAAALLKMHHNAGADAMAKRGLSSL